MLRYEVEILSDIDRQILWATHVSLKGSEAADPSFSGEVIISCASFS